MPYKDPKVHKEQNNAKSRKWYWNNRLKISKREKTWRKENPKLARIQDQKAEAKRNKEMKRQSTWTWKLRTKYGLTVKEFEAIWQKQKGLCAICGKPMKRNQFGYAVDHNHKTGKVRGILHHRCNILLSALEDSDWKAKAEAYLSIENDSTMSNRTEKT